MSTGTVILLVVVVGILASMFMRRGTAGGHGMGGCGMGHGGHDHSSAGKHADERDEATPVLGEAGQPAPVQAHDRHTDERHRHC